MSREIFNGIISIAASGLKRNLMLFFILMFALTGSTLCYAKDSPTKVNVDSKGTVMEMFDSISQWNKSYGQEPSLDTTMKRLMITADEQPSASRKNVSLNLSQSGNLKLRVYITNASKLSKISLYLSNDSSYQNYYFYPIQGFSCVDGWNEFLISPHQLLSSGSPSLDREIVSLQVRVDAKSDKRTSVIFDSLSKNVVTKPTIVLTFDDGWETQYSEAYAYLKRKEMPATIAVIPSLVGQPDYMSEDELKQLYDSGWDLVNHTYDHVDLTTVPPDTIQSEIGQGEQWLIDHGFTRGHNIVFYPNGAFNQDVLNAMPGERAGRSIVESMETSPPANKYTIKVHSILNSTSPDAVRRWIDETVQSGGTIVLVWHKIESPALVPTQYDPADFKAVIDYIDSVKDQVDVLSFTDWLTENGM